MQISPCGRYLHIISFEATVPKRRNPTNLPNASEKHEGGVQPSVHLMTYKFSEHDIQETAPTMILSVRFSLGPLTQFSFTKLPFAVTWQTENAEAHITVSESELKVYKVSLLPDKINDPEQTLLPRRTIITLDDTSENFDDQKQIGKSYVSVLRQPLLLPFSAKNRSVQYFPPLSPDRPNVTLIIGPRSPPSSTSTPPIAVYLPPTTFSTWTTLAAARKAEISSLTKIMQPLGGKFEDLGPGENLDLKRYRTLDGDLQSRASLEGYGGGGGHGFEIRYVRDLELAHGRERMVMRRVDVDDGEEGGGVGGEDREERRVFKTWSGAGTAVLRAGVREERAKMSWFCDLGPAVEVEVDPGF